MTDAHPRTAGLSGDLGWGDADEDATLLSTPLLVLATTSYFALTWISTGLAPLPVLTSRLRSLARMATSKEL